MLLLPVDLPTLFVSWGVAAAGAALRRLAAVRSPVDLRASSMVVQLANIMLRKAQNTTNARQYLMDLIDAKFDSVNTQTGQIIATTVNGKSTTLQMLPGMNLGQFLAAAELALSTLEAGLNVVPRQTWAVVR